MVPAGGALSTFSTSSSSRWWWWWWWTPSPSVSSVAAFYHYFAPPPISHLSLCPADISPFAGKSSRAGPALLRTAPGTNRPPRSSGRAAGRSFSAAPEQPSFQAERNRRGGRCWDATVCANEMNGGGEAASTGIKRDNTVACCFRLGFSNYRLVLDSVNRKLNKMDIYTSFSHYFKIILMCQRL